MSFDTRLTRLEQTFGGDPEAGPTYAIVKVYSPSLRSKVDPVMGQTIYEEEPPEYTALRDRIRASLPPSVVTVAWCGLNGRDDEGACIRLGGNGWNEVRPLPAGEPKE